MNGFNASLNTGINRIRLEFKAYYRKLYSETLNSIDRIRLEFKETYADAQIKVAAGINRIRLEFKVDCHFDGVSGCMY